MNTLPLPAGFATAVGFKESELGSWATSAANSWNSATVVNPPELLIILPILVCAFVIQSNFPYTHNQAWFLQAVAKELLCYNPSAVTLPF